MFARAWPLPASTDQDDDSSDGCRDWKCFHPWLPLLVDTRHFERSGDRGLPFSSASNPECFQTGAIVFRLATSSILGSVSSSPTLAGPIDTCRLVAHCHAQGRPRALEIAG